MALALLALLAMTPSMPKLEVSSPKFVCGYASLRRWAEVPEEEVPESCREDVRKFRDLIATAGDGKPLGPVMTLLDGLAATCRSAQDFKKVVDGLPEDWKRGTINKPWMTSVSEVLAEGEDHWTIEADEKLTTARRLELERSTVLPKSWDWLSDKLGFEGVPKSITICIVPRFAAPGGITLQTSSGVVILVSAEVFSGTALMETVLHESIHACETVATKVDLLSRIRSSDAMEKLDAADRRNLPHTLYFIAAAEAIRQGGAPEHVDVGITLKTYARAYEKYRKFIEPLWKDYLAGKIDRAKLAEAISSYKPGIS